MTNDLYHELKKCIVHTIRRTTVFVHKPVLDFVHETERFPRYAL
jgi:hypothetical protein